VAARQYRLPITKRYASDHRTLPSADANAVCSTKSWTKSSPKRDPKRQQTSGTGQRGLINATTITTPTRVLLYQQHAHPLVNDAELVSVTGSLEHY
jgi:hypothetical protein